MPRRPSQPAAWTGEPWSLQRPLLRLGPHDVWTIGDAFAGVQIFGDTGSGKTTGSGQALAMAMLRAGFGGLVLTVKSNETERWRDYLAAAGRSDDLVIFSPDSPHRFNFLEHERRRVSRGGGQTTNMAELFVTLLTAGASEGSRDPFWDRALRQLLRNAIDALRLADEPLTLSALHRVINSAPLSAQQADDDDWKSRSYLFDLLARANESDLTPQDRDDLRVTANYWLDEYAGVMDERTRGNIISTFTTTADGFMRSTLRELFCTELTISPSWTFEGKVIVLDLPSKQFHELGRMAQVIWKACWQRDVESADRGPDSRPVFLWVDEAQHFITPQEAGFVQTVREHRAACVYLTQARSNYLHALGAGHTAAVESFLGVPKTKIFHCNGDPETNEWAQRVVSEDWKQRVSRSIGERNASGPSTNGQKKEPNNSMSISRQREPRLLAREFGSLRCGGPPDYTVQAILFQSGAQFHGGEGNIVRLEFDQRLAAAER
ncbi:MAG: type IV secretory system conjugative DNA transfer family protein [Phycisphaerales bacterium]